MPTCDYLSKLVASGAGEDVEDLSKWKESRRPKKTVWSGGTPK
jgi:hypothetical protein